MAAMPMKKADPAKSFVSHWNYKQSLDKTKVLPTVIKNTITIINQGMSPCRKCELEKSNMVFCLMCTAWFHYQCQSL